MACLLFNGTEGRLEVRMRPLMLDPLTAAKRGNLDSELLRK